MFEALLYEQLSQDRVRCKLCAHRCLIRPGNFGICKVRQNKDGQLFTHVYGRAISTNVDPIEKKPLFHFLPGTLSYSVATVGCNFICEFCQNYQISQMPRDEGRIAGMNLSPEEIVRDAVKTGSASIAYTYTEPTIYFEYALETARLASKQGIKNVFVTNGYMTEETLDMIGSDLSAANVDLKAFNDDFYKKLCQARIKPVKETIQRMVDRGIWVEVTTLLIPTYNDSFEELTELARWLAGVSPDIVWHISRFHPTYRLTEKDQTATEAIHQALKIGHDAGLAYVYSGNVWGDAGEKTLCPNCGENLIDRVGYKISSVRIEKGLCFNCQTAIPGVWEAS